MDNYTVLNTHATLKRRLVDYIKAQYLMNSDILYDPIAEELEAKDNICREPFLEATPTYEKGENGLDNFSIDDEMKAFLKDLADHRLGVYHSPYLHQQYAIEKFEQGKDLLVTTGTGSGKTECFVWPMLCKMAKESMQQSWKSEGIRSLIIYPMNALVADQIGRLRRILNPESEFMMVFKNVSGKEVRVPRFGMYTGRTPYPGGSSKERNLQYGKMLKKDYIDKNDLIKAKLMEMGKWPGKKDLGGFADALINNTWSSELNPLDMELLTRHEMQRICPDVLITNYCMLEYMLIRPIESSIWDKTQAWMNAAPENKLLIVLDEAHMYRGAPGGEIALLVRRLMSRLGAARDKFQFILTSASMPQGKDDELNTFVRDLTGADEERVSIIRGVPEAIVDGTAGSVSDARLLAQIDADKLYSEDEQFSEVNKLAGLMNWQISEQSYKNQLYDYLIGLSYMRVLIKECRGAACTISELADRVFSNVESTIARKAIEVLVILGAIANKNDVFLLPMRSHIFMRGIRTAYMCINPNCPNSVEGDDLKVGNISINNKQYRCEKCGCLNFEIFVDRRCKGLFTRGYQSSSGDNDILWSAVDPLIADDFESPVDMYLIPDNLEPEQMRKLRSAGEMGYLLANTGQFIPSVSKIETIKGVRVLKGVFNTCPSCNKAGLHLRTLTTRGNEPFSNVVFEQLWAQIAKKDSVEFPNGGRKVLLFSDSRQRAARLARDMTIAADGDTGRKGIIKAAKILMEWSEENDTEITLDDLYGLFVRIVYENKLSCFYGEGEKTLRQDVEKYERRGFSRNADIQRIIRRFEGTRPELYSQQLLRQLTDSYQSLHDLAIGYLDISNALHSELLDLSNQTGIEVNILKGIIRAWIANTLDRDKAIGTDISDDIRRNLSQYTSDRSFFGLQSIVFNSAIKTILTDNGYTEEQQESILYWIEDILTGDNIIERNNNRYLKLNAIVLKVAVNEEWVRCSRCCSVFKHTLLGHCIFCGCAQAEAIDTDHMRRMDFWRAPILNMLEDEEQYKIKSLNAAEHTAQLNYVDKEEKALATTEEYEMLFQDFIDSTSSRPIDILSCTTTMEVGIDIGSLTAIGMRNVPPSRNNYQQRAGRAGRKSASVSTVITYTEDGPHDSWYFSKPNDIVRGMPGTPWIDINNPKLIGRHLNMILLTKYFQAFAPNQSIDVVYAYDFFLTDDHPSIRKFAEWIRFTFRFSETELSSLIPNEVVSIDKTYYVQLANTLDNLADNANEDPEILTVPHEQDPSSRLHLPRALDKLYKEGILPTYSFPRDVVNYWIEKDCRIKETPQRAIEIALNDYAPGRTLVVDKLTYMSGGIYNYFSRKHKNADEKYAAAEPWLALDEYLGSYYYCKRCGWMSRKASETGTCPLCGYNLIANRIVKPWGFAPKDGKSIPEVQDNQIYSSTSNPRYSTTPDTTQMEHLPSVAHLRIQARKDQKLMVVNRGPEDKGFRICSHCGASEPSNVDRRNESYHLRPYKLWTTDNQRCNGEFMENVSLGFEFLTDLLVLEIPLDKNVLNADIFEDKNMWLNPAVCTFAEALAKAAGIVLDVESLDIQAGYRFRLGSDNTVFADVYLYDKLVSGAGYSTLAARHIIEILDRVRDILSNCTCSDSCPNCLQHFHNQWIQPLLNRKLALQLVNWVIDDIISVPIHLSRQAELLSGLNEILIATKKGRILFELQGIHKLQYNNEVANIVVYPCMWSNRKLENRSDTLFLPDRIAENGLPLAFSMVEDFFMGRSV